MRTGLPEECPFDPCLIDEHTEDILVGTLWPVSNQNGASGRV